ncbi:MAG: LytTR family DNA-binding domain-containing protein [Ignavibacteriales bacterium]|nr:Transcriptional regulatory protein BtsR [Ignavibacteriaceae bacterium]MBZ0197498.1 LytTR family DNA-binding domain-containing protein [Ignavibacteriaceae bacterium]MCZ2143868.1 LytTR family DNA-binding domain-containing protein [Ignavibacteriales bacterium]WKZ72707.1 MAG: LytTR family DNA-binding domain-containing protein [Ignavibacteriaceae bacterium]
MSPNKPKRFLNAMIVDDELHGRENLRMIIDTYCPEINIVGLAASAAEAADLLENLEPDLLFLDINMPVLSGFDFLDTLKKRDFFLVFVTAYQEYGIDAIKAGASDYLLKPINIKELKITVKKLTELFEKKSLEAYGVNRDKIMIPESHGFAVITVDQITRIAAAGSYSVIFTQNGKKTVVSRTLADFEDSLPDGMFCRIHRSTLVNLDLVREYSIIDGGSVTMTDGTKIEVSRRKTAEFLQKIKLRAKPI